MYGIYVEPKGKAEYKNMFSELPEVISFFGRHYDIIKPFKDKVAIICTQDVWEYRLELNRSLYDESGNLIRVLAGPFFICGVNSETGYPCDLNRELTSKYLKMFEEPEKFMTIVEELTSSVGKTESI